MRARSIRILTGLVSGLALLDVFTGWTILNLPVLAVCLAGAAAVAIIGRRRFLLAMVCLAAVCFALHLGYSLRTDYEEDRWAQLEREKAGEALSSALSMLEERFSDVSEFVESISAREDLARSLRTNARREIFSILAEIGASAGWGTGEYGIVVGDATGAVLAWTGRLPDFVGESVAGGAAAAIRVDRSTAHYWIEGAAPVGPESEHLGSIRVFRQLDAVYPDVLPLARARALSEELTARLRHEVQVVLGGQEVPAESRSGPVEVSDEIRLPDGGAGSVVGRVIVRGRAFDDERDILRRQGLFIASLAVILLIVTGAVALGRELAGFRFHKATPMRLLFLLLITVMGRLALSGLRDFLNLDSFVAFTPLHYATQIPTGILRSPADLTITSLFMCLGIGLVMAARIYRSKAASPGGKSAGHDRLPALVLGFVGGALASGVALFGCRAIGMVFADGSLPLATLSPFDLSSSYIVMRIGVFILTVALILLVATLVGWQMTMMRQLNGRRGTIADPVLLSGITLLGLITAFVAGGADARAFLLAGLGFLCAFVMDLAVRKRLAIGLVSLAVGSALAGSLLEYPYACGDYVTKQQQAIESISSQIVARTDAWRISVLEEALAEVAGDQETSEVLAAGSVDLDAFALNLWANSILSNANVTSGVHILNRSHDQVGRFSLEDIGDLSGIEAVIREARFTRSPFTRVIRATLGGKDVELYIGVIPFFKRDSYLGSVVISIPHAYADLESMAGFKPTFFEAIGSRSGPHVLFDGTYAATSLAGGKIATTTAKDFEVGKPIAELGGIADSMPAWVEHSVAGKTYASYAVPSDEEGEALLMSFRLPSVSDKMVMFMRIIVGNVIITFLIILIVAGVKGTRHALRRMRGMGKARLRWSFAGKLALAFVLIAIVPTLILGVTSRGFLRARHRETMESKAEESLNLSRLALERLVAGEARLLARNPILIDELIAEPSILGMLVSHDVSSAVIDSTGRTLATFGDPVIPVPVLRSVLTEGRSYSFFSMDGGLFAKSAVPVRDLISPDKVRGCAFVSRRIDDALAHRLSSELGKDLNFFGLSSVAASSKRELFISELMASKIPPDAYVECFVSGRELHFTWERMGNMDVVVGYSPLRSYDGSTVGAIAAPLVFRKDDVGRHMEWTSAAISYLLVIVIGAIFIFGLLLARRISRPIRELIQGTLRIGSGDLAFTIPKSGDDEIGDLVSSFNRMTGTLAKSRKALSERKRYIETIIGNVGAGIVSTDWRGRIDTFNSAAEKMLGIRGRNARGRDAKNLLKRIGASSLAAVLAEAEGEHGVVRKEVDLAREDGGPVTLRAVATVVPGPKGRRMGKVIVFEDVTELIRSKKLIAWSEMARQVAHEIKNPLTPMKLSAQQLLQSRRDGATDFDRVLEDGVATIIEQIESLRRIAVEFSQFSRMPQRRLVSTDINRVLDESLVHYERTAGSSVEIAKTLGRSLPRLKIDPDELKRVFLNVLENAIQAMPDGGRLNIRSAGPGERCDRSAYEFRVSSRSGCEDELKRCVEISFADTGGGISPADSDKLFEPNFSTKTQGSGLGLAICKGIMDGYRGELVIESTPGTGTCVRVRIPAGERPGARHRHAAAGRPEPTRRSSRKGTDKTDNGRRPQRYRGTRKDRRRRTQGNR